MKKAALLLALLVTVGFSDITLEDAGKIAEKYAEVGEIATMKPQGLTYSGTTPYWVIELVGTMEQINVMIPINAEKGKLDTSDSMKDVLKTHYLANYFATDDTILTFLESILDYRATKKQQFTNALNQLTLYEGQLPEEAELEYLDPLRAEIEYAQEINDELRDSILDAQSLLESATWRTSNVGGTKDALNDVFSDEEDFLDALDSVAEASNEFLTELAGNTLLMTEYTNIVQAFQSTITSNGLADGAPVKTRDSLVSNKNTINSFFSGLDLVASQYMSKLLDRVNTHIPVEEINAIKNQLETYMLNYTYIYNNADTISSSYEDKIEDLRLAIKESQDYYNDENYSAAQAVFSDIDDLIETLMDHIGDCPSYCSGGKVRDSGGCECVCPTGTTEENGKCVTEGGFALNPYLIGGFILIIVALILIKYKDAIFKGGGGEEPEKKSSDMWANYKF